MNEGKYSTHKKSKLVQNDENTILKDLEIANFILILYNLNLISEETFITKYRAYIETITDLLELY